MINKFSILAYLLGLSLVLVSSPLQADTLEEGADASVNRLGETSLPLYRIGPGDILEISVWKEEGLQKEVLVRPDGGIMFPLVGQVNASGKTAEQLRSIITTKLEKFIPNPFVTVSINKITNNKVYVVGKVNRPGEFIASHYLDVMQVLALAGGLTPYAKPGDIIIIRHVNGKKVVFPFEYDAVADGENLEQNIMLQSGDTIVVP